MYKNLRHNFKKQQIETTFFQTRSQSLTYNELDTLSSDVDEQGKTSPSDFQIETPIGKKLAKENTDPMSEFKKEMNTFEQIKVEMTNWIQESNNLITNYSKDLKKLNQGFSKRFSHDREDPVRKENTKKLRSKPRILFPEEKTSPDFGERECITPPSFGVKKAKTDSVVKPHTQCPQNMMSDPKHFRAFEIDFSQKESGYSVKLVKGEVILAYDDIKIYLANIENDETREGVVISKKNELICGEFREQEEFMKFIGTVKATDDMVIVEGLIKEYIDAQKLEMYKLVFEPFSNSEAKLFPLRKMNF